ncbi:MAG: hypothetical protein ACXW12_17575, partial [Burkholderiales bacterium]
MDVSLIQPVDAAVTLAVAWIVLGIAALALARSPRWISGLLYSLGAIVALALAVTGVWAMNAPESSVVLVAG